MELIVFGGGRMGAALVGGLIAVGWAPSEAITVVEPVAAVRGELAGRFPGLQLCDRVETRQQFDGALIAVKPQYVEDACSALREHCAGSCSRVLSVAAGVPVAKIEAWLGRGFRVIRSMPNTPALVGMGASAIAGGTSCTPDDIAWARRILESVGVVEVVPESQLDAVTGLSGSGPAYVFLVAEALIEAGVLNGLSRATAHALAVQTLRGAAELLAQEGAEPALLRADVTSPGGTTAAGLKALEAGAVRHAILDAVTKATERSRVLGS